jgi:hypothetical protein
MPNIDIHRIRQLEEQIANGDLTLEQAANSMTLDELDFWIAEGEAQYAKLLKQWREAMALKATMLADRGLHLGGPIKPN